MSKVEIDVWAGGRTDEPFIVSDKFGRLRMSSGLIEMLSCKGASISLYVGYDSANKRIALGKPDIVRPTDSKAVNFDAARHYGNVRGFMLKHRLPLDKVRYVYDGKSEGWLLFKREDYRAPDGRGTP